MPRPMCALVVLVIAFLSACQREQDGSTSITELTSELQSSMREARELLGQRLTPIKDDLQNRTTEEIKKLHAVEYRVVSFPSDSPPARLEQELSKLGEQRWDCFYMQQTAQGLTAFCKRRPESYLRYVTKFGGW